MILAIPKQIKKTMVVVKFEWVKCALKRVLRKTRVMQFSSPTLGVIINNYFQLAMNESSPAIQPSISSTVLGTMLISSVPVSVMMTSSSILTPPKPLYSLILSTTKNLLNSGSAKAHQLCASLGDDDIILDP